MAAEAAAAAAEAEAEAAALPSPPPPLLLLLLLLPRLPPRRILPLRPSFCACVMRPSRNERFSCCSCAAVGLTRDLPPPPALSVAPVEPEAEPLPPEGCAQRPELPLLLLLLLAPPPRRWPRPLGVTRGEVGTLEPVGLGEALSGTLGVTRRLATRAKCEAEPRRLRSLGGVARVDADAGVLLAVLPPGVPWCPRGMPLPGGGGAILVGVSSMD